VAETKRLESIIGPQATTVAPVDAKARNLVRRGPSMVTVSSVDNEETMAWLEESLNRVRHQKQVKLTRLLEAVRDEVAFELELLEAGGLAHGRPGLRRSIGWNP
jgi:hypothetical protein